MWFKKNKWKVIVTALIASALTLAFWYGGTAPGSRGFVAADKPSPQTVSPARADVTDRPSATPAASPAAPTESEAPAQANSEVPAAAPEPDISPKTPETPSPAVEIPQTVTDKYLTDPVPEGKPPPVEPQDTEIGNGAHTCTISISCATILDNMELLDSEKHELVPDDGWILPPITTAFYEGESVFHILRRTCKEQKIHMEFMSTPIYNSAYIEGIHNLYEFDVGELSGWMYEVNGWFPNYGCSRYQLSDGDVVNWVYTCDLGFDVGGGYATGGSEDA
ncbi:MAG: DUF4430 domain-containing protein [Clostridiales bacterium]|nr:DUF4430 domain-containing protein [Clostridiales bacterium]